MSVIPYTQDECEAFMRLALDEARRAARFGEVPVGCVIVENGRVLATGFNRRETRRDPTAHAEVIALREAARKKGTWYLDDCTLFVTLEPCPMCAGALVNARVGGLVYGAADPKAGACHTLFSLCSDARLNHVLPVQAGVLAKPCGDVLSAFFRELRRRRRLAD